MSTIESNPQGNTNGWAKPIDKLKVSESPKEAINLNVEGRQLSGLTHGFGQLWQKTYKVRLSGVKISPQEVISAWKANFPKFWPEGNDLYVPLTGIQPGEVGLINLSAPGGLKLSTGIMVIYADDISFSFMTPEGHMFAGMITFSAYEEDNGTFAQIQALIRANDPIYELSFRMGFGHKSEDAFWAATLKNLAQHLGVNNPQPTQANSLVDPRMQWREWRNIWHNAGIRSGLYMPVALVKKVFNITI
ncbi:MAG TPA: hypothetical protein DEH22_17920 [Chloroflexi bacterium]|nr:hypothetical protein [Chloroflexota bacterium]